MKATQACVLAALLIVLAALGAPQSSAWAVQDLAAGEVDAAAAVTAETGAAPTTLVTQATEYPYKQSSDVYISVYNKTSGSASYNTSTSTLTLTNLVADDVDICLPSQSITLNLVGTSTLSTSLYTYASLTVKGSGTFNGRISSSSADKPNITVAGGTINGKISANNNLTVTGGTIVGDIYCSASLNMSGGTIDGTISCSGKMTMKGGTLKSNGKDTSGYTTVALYAYGLDMSGGAITVANPTSTAVSVHGTFNLSSGSIKITDAGGNGISTSSGNFTMTGGTLDITCTDQYDYAISIDGKAAIKGGSVTAKTADAKTDYAIYAKSMTNKLGTLKTIVGKLAKGAQFKVKKNLYKVDGSTYVALMKYNASAKKATVNTVTYGKHSYEIDTIGKGAFNTAAGKKVTSINVNSYLSNIAANAFANTKALKSLSFKYTGWIKRNYDAKYNLKSVTVNTASDCSVAKKAFSKAGKGGGKGLTVKLGSNGVYRKEVGKYRSFLKSRGLSSKAKLKTY